MNDLLRRTPSVAAQALAFVAIALTMLGTFYVFDSIGPVAELLSRQRGFSDLQIGSLNAIYSLPNIFVGLVGGILADRYGARAVIFVTAVVCLLGATLTAVGPTFLVMVSGRLLFGIGAETLQVAILVALSRWFMGRSFALVMALNTSLARLGSYLADRSPSIARPLYAHGWQPPLWLAVGFATLALTCASIYWIVDRRESARVALADKTPARRIDWRTLPRFRAEYWYLVGLCIAFYSAIFPFRSTFAIKYFQQARGLSLEDASRMNSYVFLAAVFATPAFGFLVDRLGGHATLMVLGSLLLPVSFLLLGADHVDLWIPTTMLGVSFSLIPAVLWPSIARHVVPTQRGTAYGTMAMLQSTGLTVANVFAGYLNDRSLASTAHPQGYASMLWFFGLLSLVGFLFAALFKWRDGRNNANKGIPMATSRPG